MQSRLSGKELVFPGQDHTHQTGSWVVFELDGPRCAEQSHNDFVLEVLLSAYVQTKSRTNFYDHQTLIGLVSAAMFEDIPIINDDEVTICCLSMYANISRALHINDEGIVKYHADIQQAVVRVYYTAELGGS